MKVNHVTFSQIVWRHLTRLESLWLTVRPYPQQETLIICSEVSWSPEQLLNVAAGILCTKSKLMVTNVFVQSVFWRNARFWSVKNVSEVRFPNFTSAEPGSVEKLSHGSYRILMGSKELISFTLPKKPRDTRSRWPAGSVLVKPEESGLVSGSSCVGLKCVGRSNESSQNHWLIF